MCIIEHGVSLVNFQWATFATGASALGVVALICGAFIICCLWKAKSGRRMHKNQERLLAAISTISSPTGGSSPPGRPPVPTTNPAPIAGADWIRTPSGWTSVPTSYVNGPSGLPRLPFPQFPPLLYDGDFSRCGYPTCRRETIKMRWSFPALSFDRGSPSSPKSGMNLTSGRGEMNPGLLATVHLSDVTPQKGPPHLLKPSLQGMSEDKSTEPVSNLLASNTDNYKVMPRESVSSFNDCKSSASGNFYIMEVRF